MSTKWNRVQLAITNCKSHHAVVILNWTQAEKICSQKTMWKGEMTAGRYMAQDNSKCVAGDNGLHFGIDEKS